MLFYPIEKLVGAGITDIMVVTGVDHAGSIINCLGSGKAFNCNLTYRVQDTAGGIAQALGLAKGFAYGERICVLLGDNIFEDSLQPMVEHYNTVDRGAMVVLKDVPNPQRYGVAELMEKPGTKIVGIEEKPKNPKSQLAVTGIYFYDQKVFKIIENLKPSDRGELEITDVNNVYIEWDELGYFRMDGLWLDCGTHETLIKANQSIEGFSK
jgi:glucose-1-phosphate thymidylyltransferase